MNTTLTLAQVSILFTIMIAGAAVPGVSVVAVAARSAASGFAHGVATTIGIIIGDIAFILLAVFGALVVVEALGEWFFMIKLLCAAYLIWLGIKLHQSRPTDLKVEAVAEHSLISSFATGLLITLGDQKAIFFYLGFFPALLDLSKITFVDTGLIILLAIFCIAVAKLSYAAIAIRAKLLLSAQTQEKTHRIAGSILILAGIYIVLKDYLGI